MEAKDTPETVAFRRRAELSSFERRLKTYAQWAPIVPLREKGALAENVYNELAVRVDKLREEERASKKFEPSAEESKRLRLQRQSKRQELPWARQALAPLWSYLQDVAAAQCVPISGVERNLTAGYEWVTASDGHIQTTRNPGLVGTLAGLDIALTDAGHNSDSTHGNVCLRADLPKAPCDGFYLWFADLHVVATSYFGNGVDSGSSAFYWSYRTDINAPAGLGFDLMEPTTPLMYFTKELDYVDPGLEPEDFPEPVVGSGVWETSFQVSQCVPVRAGDVPVVRVYLRGYTVTDNGRTETTFGEGLYDSWAAQAGSAYGDSIKGIRYMTFGPMGFL